MTEQELQAIEQRANAATPGPWVDGTCADDCWVETSPEAPDYGSTSIAQQVDRTSAPFIANARQDIPALLAEVRRLQEKIEYYKTELASGNWRPSIQNICTFPEMRGAH